MVGYLIYKVNVETSNTIPPRDVSRLSSQQGKYNVVIDLNKKDSDRSFFEKTLLFFFGDDIKQTAADQNLRAIQGAPKAPIFAVNTIISGIRVRIKALDLNKMEKNPEQKPQNIIVTVGEDDKIPISIQEKMIGLTVGQVSVIEAEGERFRIEVLEISPQLPN